MPATILGTQMDSGHFKWRPKTSGLDDPGPSDRTLVVEISGNISDIPGFQSNSVDIAEFRSGCPIIERDWIPPQGDYRCEILNSGGRKRIITIDFSAST